MQTATEKAVTLPVHGIAHHLANAAHAATAEHAITAGHPKQARHPILTHVDKGGAAPLLTRHLTRITLHNNAATLHAATERAETSLPIHGHHATRPHSRVFASAHDAHARSTNTRIITGTNTHAARDNATLLSPATVTARPPPLQKRRIISLAGTSTHAKRAPTGL